MEFIQWTNGKGYTLKADSGSEFELLRQSLDEQRGSLEVEIDEGKLVEQEIKDAQY